jgi:hypothetical protein
MKNPYAVGFYCALSALVVMTVSVFCSKLTSAGGESAFSFVSSFSSLIQALAAIVVGGLAFRGLNTWKHSIIHGKALGIVWDANVALRQVEDAWVNYYVEHHATPAKESKADLYEKIQSGELGRAFKAFKYQCILLDKVVVKRGWEWQNHSMDLEEKIFFLAEELNKEPVAITTTLKGRLIGRSDEKLAKLMLDIDVFIEVYGTLLDKLENQYSL